MAKELKFKTTKFKDELYPIAEKSLKSKGSSLLTAISKYMDKNSSVLYSKGPDQRLFFGDKDRDIVYQAIGISPMKIKETIKNLDFIGNNWQIMNNPFNTAISLVIRYYTLANNKKGIELAITYFALSLYSSTQSNFFKYTPNPAIMEFTINNMSNKYLLKQTGNIFGAIYQTQLSCYNNFKDMIVDFYDEHVKDFIMSSKDRQNSFMQNILREYKQNQTSGKYLNFVQDNEDEENFVELENTSSIIANLVTASHMAINKKTIEPKLLKLSAGMADVSVNATRTALINIIQNNNNEIKKIFTLILQLFLSEEGNNAEDIGSQKFINYCWNLYIKSNTKDKSILEIKDILDKWLEQNSKEYVRQKELLLNLILEKLYIFIWYLQFNKLIFIDNYFG